MSAVSTLGLGAERVADPASYAISNTVPRFAVRPATRDEVVEAVRAAATDDLKVVPWGGGVSLHMVRAPERYDVAIDLTALDRIVEYDPDDLTITAECGVTLRGLRDTLAARGQELPLEGARGDVATLGGALAANTSGARRLRFGAPVDRILGARFVLGDATFARSGGRVVKNVAG
jgi:glycolate oxidase FAD binding subunit